GCAGQGAAALRHARHADGPVPDRYTDGRQGALYRAWELVRDGRAVECRGGAAARRLRRRAPYVSDGYRALGGARTLTAYHVVARLTKWPVWEVRTSLRSVLTSHTRLARVGITLEVGPGGGLCPPPEQIFWWSCWRPCRQHDHQKRHEEGCSPSLPTP